MSLTYDIQFTKNAKESKAEFRSRVKGINHPLIEKIFNVYAPKYAKRKEELNNGGGYTRVIKLGTKVYVTGSYKDLGVCYAEDTGGKIKGNRIDVFLDGTLEELLQFGRRSMRVYILE